MGLSIEFSENGARLLDNGIVCEKETNCLWTKKKPTLWHQIDPEDYNESKENNTLYSKDVAWRLVYYNEPSDYVDWSPAHWTLRCYRCRDLSMNKKFFGEIEILNLAHFTELIKDIKEIL